VIAEALKVSREFGRERKKLRIEALDLLDGGTSVLGEVEDVDLTLREDDAHTDSRVSEGVDGVSGARVGIAFETDGFEHLRELSRCDTRGSHAVLIVGQEEEVVGLRIGMPLPDALIDGDRALHRVRHARPRLAASDGEDQALGVFGYADVAVTDRKEFGRDRSDEGVCAEHRDVIELPRGSDSSTDDRGSVIIFDAFQSSHHALVGVALFGDERVEAKEGARVVVPLRTWRRGNVSDEPIGSSLLHDVSKGCSDRSERGRTDVGSPLREIVDEGREISRRDVSNVFVSEPLHQGRFDVGSSGLNVADVYLSAIRPFGQRLQSDDAEVTKGGV